MSDRLTADEVVRAYARGQGKQPESLILKSVRAYLTQFGWYVVRIQQGMGCHKGVADLVAIREGRTVWIEVKTPSGRQSDAQRDFERQVKAHGGEYVIARSVEDAAAMSGDGCLL